ncbi:MAG TPA: patatin-like phospholipase family protein [Thermoanaerobaculia bacterium]|nr:patatin-like phospholipase family protein [Thermoanaerobaculia bacterium]
MQKTPALWTRLASRYADSRPRRMLALDGGGIRGMITLQILKRIEEIVGQTLGTYFDYIAGTSTGAIIAAGLARGKTVDELITFYRETGPLMFDERTLFARWKSLYSSDPLAKELKKVFGEKTTLSPDDLDCLLLVVTRNATTDSPWPVSSNPEAKYCGPERPDCNLKLPLWQLVRASTAAPVYFPPEVIQLDKDDPKKDFVFVDGGTTAYNNPAFLLYRMATLAPYNLEWERGEKKLLLISVGTGSAPATGPFAVAPESNLFAGLKSLAFAVMYAAQVDQDINCRTVGRCVYGAPIDRELGDLVVPDDAPDHGRAFRYARYDADLSAKGLDTLGVKGAIPEKVQQLDAIDQMDTLVTIGQAVASRIERKHFGTFLP